MERIPPHVLLGAYTEGVFPMADDHGVLWFSPFGPLQLVLGFPVNPRSFEDSPVFEFSVGGLGI